MKRTYKIIPVQSEWLIFPVIIVFFGLGALGLLIKIERYPVVPLIIIIAVTLIAIFAAVKLYRRNNMEWSIDEQGITFKTFKETMNNSEGNLILWQNIATYKYLPWSWSMPRRTYATIIITTVSGDKYEYKYRGADEDSTTFEDDLILELNTHNNFFENLT